MSEFRKPYEFNKKFEVDLTNPRYRFLLMDLHGTIADRQLWSLKGMTETWKSKFGFNAPVESYRNALHRGNMSYSEFLKNLLETDTRLLQYHRNENAETIGRTFDDLMKNIYIPMPGMRRVMKQFLDASIEIAILTNGPKTEVIQNHLVNWGFPELAERVFNGPTMQTKKPKREAVDYVFDVFTANGYEFDRSEALIVGDHMDDTAVALNAGIDSALIIRPIKTKQIHIEHPHPTYVVDNPFDLIDVVAGNVEPMPAEDGEVTVHAPFFTKI